MLRFRFPVLGRSRRGVAAVEFALIAPLLIALLGASVDLGRAIITAIRLETAVRSGAEFIIQNPGADPATVQTVVRDAFGTGATATVTWPRCACLNATTGSPESAPGAADPNLCTSLNCPGGIVGYRDVTASAGFTAFFPARLYTAFVANVGGTITRNVTVRI
ncbi:TadE/TadG family type IV pilus assembly protein [Falsiroseomonas oryziterrae]|uniref:TadE/TadG family type IV pilus assembly protein n=1 Tax=Falsiroseomonas oryziterrae TaxID=2911368 RepID=UPI001F298DB8|nr:TadE/TadG family type IV pilus assembly protein [Roseomonas sp. NPKOSM-4]